MKQLRELFSSSPVTPFSEAEIKIKGGFGFRHNGVDYVHHSRLPPAKTAYSRVNSMQLVVLSIMILLLTLGFVAQWHTTLVVFVSIITSLYFTDLLFNLFLIVRSFLQATEITVKERAISDRKSWPTYTILCPLYKEWKVVPQFVEAMQKISYPKEKLQIMLLLEEDDKESIEEIQKMKLPSTFEIRVVPHSKPKTKPKACNYGLQFAKGEYTVIYDAEDIPDIWQLKKSVLAFEQLPKNVACLQAKLNFYNPNQNLLSRIFTAEYSLWFELVLTGLQSISAPIPLGGTSNHFRTKDLDVLGGWDSFNVTEDCDLGMRLSKNGLTTAILDSVTLEEANSDLKNWFNQRTRWIKGYVQTYFMHMRDLTEFSSKRYKVDGFFFQLIVGGKVFSMLINPFMWGITISYFVFRSHVGNFIDTLFLAPVFYMGTISLFLGNMLYLYFYMVGCAKHGHYGLVKYAIFVPFYWLAMSFAAWVAVYEFIVAPHYWSKTKHGLHLQKNTPKTHTKKSQSRNSFWPRFAQI